MTAPTQIRRATAQDAKTLAVLAEKTFRATYTRFNTPENMQAHCEKSFGESLQRAEIEDSGRETWVVELDGQLVAYAQLILDAPCPSMAETRGIELLRFYVDASQQGTGLAYRLMAELVARGAALGADVLWLGVWNQNERAIAFYKKCGFKHVADKTFTVGDDVQQDFVMGRELH